MLRALVLLLALVNAGLYWWLHDNPQALQSDREPQRLGHQVSPDAVKVLPDLPAASAPAAQRTGSAASQSALAASGADVAQAAAASAPESLAREVGTSTLACSETPPLNDAEFAALKTALTRTGLPDQAIGERRQTKGGAWIVYLGRYADVWQEKAAELRKLDVKFDRVNAPAVLAPGMSLGQFTSQGDAAKKLDELTRHGVHGARVAVLDAPIILRHLQVHAADAGWRRAAVGQRFDSCPLDTPSST